MNADTQSMLQQLEAIKKEGAALAAGVRLPLGAYFAFILAHNRRHLWQGREVRSSPDFPTR